MMYNGTGGRKTAVARVYIKKGTGKSEVIGNKRRGNLQEYFSMQPSLSEEINSPLKLLGKEKEFDILARVKGGGNSGQAGAIRLALARALLSFNSEYRAALKNASFLTVDSRRVERKKIGHKKSRKKEQFSKR